MTDNYQPNHFSFPIMEALTDIRRALGLSRSALYWLFEPYGGVAAYLLERRLARVRALLADRREHRRISELAFAHGFASEAHFSRAFRRCFGLTPSDVRGTAERPEPKGPTEAGPTYRAWVRRGQSC